MILFNLPRQQVITIIKKTHPHIMAISKKTGSILAHLQSAVDDLMTIGFKKLKSFGKKPEVEIIDSHDTSIKTTVIKGAKKTAKFVGEVGESYYQTYENLKKKK